MRVLSRWIAVGLFVLAPDVAMADLISDEEAQCRKQEVGKACEAGGEAGTCQKSTCSRNDYSEGAPPKTKQVECMICKPGAPASEAKDEATSKSDGCTVGSPAPVGIGVFLFGCAFWMRRRS